MKYRGTPTLLEMEERRNINEAVAEAENKPLDFDPKARAKYVRDMIKQVEAYVAEGKTAAEIAVRMPTFKENFQHFFDLLTDPAGYNKQNLTTMLAMLDRMGSGQVTQHQASMVVGQRLANTYNITPDKLPPPSS